MSSDNFEKDVMQYIRFDDYFEGDGAQKQRIIDALKKVYESDTIKEMFKNICQHAEVPFEIKYVKGKLATQILFDKNMEPTKKRWMELDLDLLKTANYIDNYGKAVEVTLEAVLAHELVHLLLTGYYDDGVGSPDIFFNGDDTDYLGKTVKLSNEIYKELGIVERNAYVSRDATGETLERN